LSGCDLAAMYGPIHTGLAVMDLAFGESFGLAAVNGDRVYYATDLWAQWTRTDSAMNQFALAVTFVSATLAYAGTDDGVYASVAQGHSWSKVAPASPPGPLLLNSFSYHASSNTLWIATYGNGVW